MINQTLASALAFFLVVASCSKKNEQETSSGDLPTKAVTAALKAVPADAVFVLTIASPKSFWDLSVNQNIFPIQKEQAEALNTALHNHVKEHLGLDVRNVQSVVAFATESGGAAVVGPVKGELRGASDQSGLSVAIVDANAEVIAAIHEDMLIVGQQESVVAAAASLQGKSETFAGEFAEFTRSQIQSSYLSAAAKLDGLPLPPTPFTQGLRRAGLKVDTSGIHVTVTGEAETLNMLKSQMQAGVEMGLSVLKSEMESSKSDFALGAGAILAYYNAESLASALKPVVDGETMRVDFDLLGGGVGGMTIVAGIGILSAIAIPAFMKYIKKSKTSEAVQFLKKMSDGARVHYYDGTSLDPLAASPKSFPESVGPTPPLGTCCALAEKCMPNDEIWQHPTWQALDFAMWDPHYYSYEFVSETVNGVPSYTVKAYGDLDCDGQYSTFSMYGEVVDGEPMASQDVIKENALE